MTLGKLIVLIIVGLVILMFIMFPEFRSLFKGFTRIFIKDLATTPEGAEAIYAEKIEQAQEAYSKAKLAMQRAVGKLSTTRNDLNVLKARLKEVEKDCESLVKNGDMESAQIKAEQREEILSDIARTEKLVEAYQTAADTTSEVHKACEKNLAKLKKEARETVENMKTKKQLSEIYNETDELMATTATDKLLTSVREKNKELDELAEGSRVVHESKTSTKLEKAEANARRNQSNDYLQTLKKKYNK